MSVKSYPFGQQIILQATFEQTVNGVDTPTDFDEVHLHIEKPNGTELHLTYPGGLTKVDTGVYEHAITPEAAGVWWYRFSGENSGQLVTATEDMKFQVYTTRMSL